MSTITNRFSSHTLYYKSTIYFRYIQIISLKDRAEMHYLKSQFLLFIPLFFFPLILGGKRKGKRITKVVILSHAFLLDPFKSTMRNKEEIKRIKRPKMNNYSFRTKTLNT